MFNLVSKYTPSGDQPKAIEKIIDGINDGKKHQVLLGATGTGKTFTIANVIKEVNKPTLVLAHNKILLDSYIESLRNYFLIMLLSILYHIMIIINLRLMFLVQILI